MKTVSLATLLLRMASVTVTPIRRMTATHTANGARARMAAVIGPPPGAGDTRANSCVARPRSDHVGILRVRTAAVQGGATIRVGDDPPQAGDAGTASRMTGPGSDDPPPGLCFESRWRLAPSPVSNAPRGWRTGADGERCARSAEPSSRRSQAIPERARSSPMPSERPEGSPWRTRNAAHRSLPPSIQRCPSRVWPTGRSASSWATIRSPYPCFETWWPNSPETPARGRPSRDVWPSAEKRRRLSSTTERRLGWGLYRVRYIAIAPIGWPGA